jgi:predicted DNA-binding protein YlxM (UPF0122 family)
VSTIKVIKQRKYRKLSDAAFVKKYLECGSQVELARMLKVSRQAIGDRLKRIGKDKIEQARTAGQISVHIDRTQDVAFKQGKEIGLRRWRYFDALQQVLHDQEELAERIKSEIKFWLSVPGRNLKPIHLQSLLAIQQGIVRTATAQHIVRKDMTVVESFDVFCESVVCVLQKYDSDAVQKIYRELMEHDSKKTDLFTGKEPTDGK